MSSALRTRGDRSQEDILGGCAEEMLGEVSGEVLSEGYVHSVWRGVDPS